VVSRAVWHVAGGVGHGEQRKRALCGAGKLRRRHAEQLLPLGLRQYPAVLCRGGGAIPRHRLSVGEHDFLAFTSADFVVNARAAHPDFPADGSDCPPLEGGDGRQLVADAHAETPATRTGNTSTLLTLYLWKNIGAVNLLFLIGLQGIEPSVFDAASVDGASHRTIAIRIALPMLCTVTLFAIIYLAMNGMRIFRESYLLYGMYPPKPLYFIQNYVNNHFTKLDYGLLSAGSSLFALVMTGLFLCIWLFLQRKEDA